MKNKNLFQILQYIENYIWEKHLQGETKKAAAEQKVSQLTENQKLNDRDAGEGDDAEKEKRKYWWGKFTGLIRRIGKKWKERQG